MIVTDRSTITPPPCPQCQTPVEIDWIDITRLGKLPATEYIPGKLTCPTNEDHDVTTAYVELTWPRTLTDEDRAWLRSQLQHGDTP